MARRIGQGIVFVLALWGLVTLGIVAYTAVHPTLVGIAPIHTVETDGATRTPVRTEAVRPSVRQTEGFGATKQTQGVSATMGRDFLTAPPEQFALPPLPPGWQWYSITPNTPTSRPPALLLGLPVGSMVYGEENWVGFFLPGLEKKFRGPNGFGPQLQKGGSCESLQPTGETWTVAGSPATVYQLSPRLSTGKAALCFEFLYQGEPWRLLMINIGPDDWVMAYTIASLVVPKPQ